MPPIPVFVALQQVLTIYLITKTNFIGRVLPIQH